MLIPFSELKRKFKLDVSGVVHVGAHEGQEYKDYRASFGNIPILWIEADPTVFIRLKETIPAGNCYFANALVSDESDQMVTFNVANNEQSSSMLELGTHEHVHPEVVYVDQLTLMTSTLDEIVSDPAFSDAAADANFLNMDVQGAEDKVIAGGHDFLNKVEYIYTEVNRDALYKGGVLLPDLDDQLEEQGFRRMQTLMHEHLGWGDALYMRR